MSQTITIVTGSARPNSVGAALLPLVRAELEKHEDVAVQVADLKQLDLPFVDSEIIPSSDDFAPTHDSVKRWQQIVQTSDKLILIAPEYNNQISALQKNALDWLYADWVGKQIAIVAYSWSGGTPVVELLDKLIVKVGATPVATPTQLYFKKDIDLDGTILDQTSVDDKIRQTVDELLAA